MNSKAYIVATVVVIALLLIVLGYFTYYMLYSDRMPDFFSSDDTTQDIATTTDDTSVPVATTTDFAGPYIKVNTPNGGETYCSGDTVGVRWASQGVNRVRVGLVSGSAAVGTGVEVPAASGYYAWTVPAVSAANGAGNEVFAVSIIEVVPPTATSSIPLSDKSDQFFTIDSCTAAVAPTAVDKD